MARAVTVMKVTCSYCRPRIVGLRVLGSVHCIWKPIPIRIFWWVAIIIQSYTWYMTSISFLKTLCLHVLEISHGYSKSKCLCMVHPFHIFLNFQTNISKCLILWISLSQISVSGISLGYLHSIQPRASAALGALRLLRTRVAISFFAVYTLYHCDATLLSRSNQQAPRRGFPCPNCHSIAFSPIPSLYLSLRTLPPTSIAFSSLSPLPISLSAPTPPTSPFGIFVRPISIPAGSRLAACARRLGGA